MKNFTDMASKTISTVVAVIFCLLLLPIGIAIFGGIFGLIGGLIGIIAGVFGAVLGAFFHIVGWLIRLPFFIFHGSFFHVNFVAICLIVLVIVLITRKSK